MRKQGQRTPTNCYGPPLGCAINWKLDERNKNNSRRLPARLPGHVRYARRSRRRPRYESLAAIPIIRPTQGFLCTKVTRYLERVYNPDRVLYPMRRVGAKGEGRFERISWDEALDTIARRFGEIAESPDGPEAILPYSYGGTMGVVNSGSMDRRFFNRLGASKLARTICSQAGGDALKYTVGIKIGTDMENFHRARLIVLWGTNTLSSNIHLWPEIKAAVENGARLIGIDPYRNHTLDHCHQLIQLQPGTDAAFALAMMNVIISEGLEDRDYIERYTLGFDKLRERAAEFPPSRAAAICGVNEEEIVQLRARVRDDAARRSSESTTACSVTRAEGWPCAQSRVCRRSRVRGGTRRRRAAFDKRDVRASTSERFSGPT